MADVDEVLDDTTSRMEKSVTALERELGGIRTGRASPRLVESLLIDYYGVPTPLNQIASITVPEARLLMIQPWDRSAMKEVEKSIMKSALGLMPNSDGTVIRLSIPPLTEDRRRDLVRLVGRKVEDGHVAVRNIRRSGVESVRSMERDKELSQDELRRAQSDLQDLTDLFVSQMDEMKKDKEQEVMEV
jgi:ribosome recycling factor